MTYKSLRMVIGGLVLATAAALAGISQADNEKYPIGWTSEGQMYQPGMYLCKTLESVKNAQVNNGDAACGSNTSPVIADVEVVEHWNKAGEIIVIVKVTITGFHNGLFIQELPQPDVMYSVYSFDGGHGEMI